jgi:four helix bundle protein
MVTVASLRLPEIPACLHLQQMEPYERFHAWRACHELNLLVAQETDRWPKSERFELTAQLRRAAWSAVANIVEGSAKRGPREFRRYLDFTIGSLAEVSYALRFAVDRGILSGEAQRVLETKHAEAARLTWGLYKRVAATAKATPSG